MCRACLAAAPVIGLTCTFASPNCMFCSVRTMWRCAEVGHCGELSSRSSKLERGRRGRCPSPRRPSGARVYRSFGGCRSLLGVTDFAMRNKGVRACSCAERRDKYQVQGLRSRELHGMGSPIANYRQFYDILGSGAPNLGRQIVGFPVPSERVRIRPTVTTPCRRGTAGTSQSRPLVSPWPPRPTW